MKFKITYTGQDNVIVEAKNEKEAIDKFWEEGLNDLSNAEVDEVNLISEE